jgi:hypothetical protein
MGSEPTFRDINAHDTTEIEVNKVVDAQVIKRLKNGVPADKAAKEVWDRVRDRTGKDHKQSHVNRGY